MTAGSLSWWACEDIRSGVYEHPVMQSRNFHLPVPIVPVLAYLYPIALNAIPLSHQLELGDGCRYRTWPACQKMHVAPVLWRSGAACMTSCTWATECVIDRVPGAVLTRTSQEVPVTGREAVVMIISGHRITIVIAHLACKSFCCWVFPYVSHCNVDGSQGEGTCCSLAGMHFPR